jgi:hypothetical protein
MPGSRRFGATAVTRSTVCPHRLQGASLVPSMFDPLSQDFSPWANSGTGRRLQGDRDGLLWIKPTSAGLLVVQF